MCASIWGDISLQRLGWAASCWQSDCKRHRHFLVSSISEHYRIRKSVTGFLAGLRHFTVLPKDKNPLQLFQAMVLALGGCRWDAERNFPQSAVPSSAA